LSIATETVEVTADKNQPDNFTFDLCSFDLHFPCAVCVHREGSVPDVCRACAYFFG